MVARVLILDGHGAALAFVRSLGRAGHWVCVGSSQGRIAPAALSRFCRLHFEYPPPTSSATDFCSAVIRLVQRHAIDLVVPITDATVWPLSRYREGFPCWCRLAIGPHRALQATSDKYVTVGLAQGLGVPVPETRLIRAVQELGHLGNWSFPLVIKDRFSIRWVKDNGVAGRVSYAYSHDDLVRQIEQRLDSVEDVLVQEFVAGTGVGLSCFALEESVRLPFQWRRIREKDPRGSGSSARISVSLDPEVVRHCQELIVRAGFVGLAMVEFKKQTPQGRFVLMEINSRPWGSIQLPIHCGIDYPLHLLKWHLEGHSLPEQIDYKKGITCRWLAGDLVHLENVWAGKPSGWPLEYPNFWTSLAKVGIPWYPGLRYDDLSFSDPRPGLAEVGSWIRAHVGGKV